jgi:PmbA protein
MRRHAEVAALGLKALKSAGLEKAECTIRHTRRDELNLDSGEISLLRTTDDVSLTLTGIAGNREASITLNKTDGDSINEAALKTLEMAESSEPDPANDISPSQPPGEFHKGPESPDLDMMYERMKGFLDHASSTYPTLILEQVILDFYSVRKIYMNSNGVDLRSGRGWYNFTPMFTSKEGKDTSSFNYAGVSMSSLDRELHLYGTIDTLMRQSTEQVRSKEFSGKFTGDVIITPDCLEEFIYYMCMYLNDYPMIKGTSIFKDSLGTRIADPSLTIRCLPLSEDLASTYFITDDGFRAGDMTLVEEGILKSFLLSLYGANKTGRERAQNGGGAFVVEPGQRNLEDMISSVDRGILLCRFSGGMPSEGGDFSGVAKNSYYIENGRIMHPVKEVMISGNLMKLLMDIRDVSSQRVNTGGSILPWIRASDVSVFGK